MMRFLSTISVLLLLNSLPAAAADLTHDRQVQEFMDEMVQTHQFERDYLQRLFKKTEIHQSILDAISRPAESKPWHEYRKIFLTSSRINGGERFWEQNAETLARAQEVYGVPAEIIIAIIGVETRYGRNKGRYPVMDALATLAFRYPKRAEFFRKELVEFLLLCREEGMNPLRVKGSYAGAMGTPQFIPSSYRRYAVDFDGDGKRDLLDSTADAIGSVANYFKEHSWITGEAVTRRAQSQSNNHKDIVELGMKPNVTLEKMETEGIQILDPELPRDQLGALIELENDEGPEHWVGLQNFYVITRYNHSPLYAMAVYQLSQKILARFEPGMTEN